MKKASTQYHNSQKIMNLVTGISLCAFPILSLACTTPSLTPLDQVILLHRKGAIEAQEKYFLEEFIKYKELHHTFVLHAVTKVTIEAETRVQTSNKKTTTSEIKFEWPPAFTPLTFEKEIAVTNEHAGKVTLELLPLGRVPGTYRAIKEVFDKTGGRNETYGLAYYDFQGAPITQESWIQCQKAQYCIPITGLKDAEGRQAFGFILDVLKFRKLYDEIRIIEPAKEPGKSN